MTGSPHGRPGALIVGGAHGSLGLARSLGRHGIPVGFITDDNLIARFSRYVSFSAPWAGPNRAEAAAELLSFGRERGLDGWVLLAGGDAEVQMMARRHTELSALFRVTAPDWETAQWAIDKRLTHERAAALRIPHPWSHYPRDRHDVMTLDCRFPVILKPSIRTEANAFTLAKAWRADDRETLLARYDQAVAAVGERGVVLQELIPGGGETQFSYAAVFDHGTPIASLVARRTRQYPIDFGYSSTLVESIDNPEVEDAGLRFLESLDYTGLAEVEFKYDSRDRAYKLLDVNSRAWTWNSLGAGAGVDFPYLLWRIAMGEPVRPARGRAGATWIHASRDFVAACQEIAVGRLSLLDYLKSLHVPAKCAAFSLDDPLPGLMDLPLLAVRLLTRRLPVMARNLRQRIAMQGPP